MRALLLFWSEKPGTRQPKESWKDCSGICAIWMQSLQILERCEGGFLVFLFKTATIDCRQRRTAFRSTRWPTALCSSAPTLECTLSGATRRSWLPQRIRCVLSKPGCPCMSPYKAPDLTGTLFTGSQAPRLSPRQARCHHNRLAPGFSSCWHLQDHVFQEGKPGLLVVSFL